MEQTLFIIKPDAVGRNLAGEILCRVEAGGFRIRGMKMVRLRLDQAQGFYAIHQGKSFYGPLTEFMSSGPAIVSCLERDGAIAGLRELIGSTDPAGAARGTIRREFATDVQHNVVHASDGPDTARQEIAFFFSQSELV